MITKLVSLLITLLFISSINSSSHDSAFNQIEKNRIAKESPTRKHCKMLQTRFD
jgi:hypothetical protein